MDDVKRCGYTSTQQILEQTKPADFSALDPNDPIDSAYRSLLTHPDGVRYQNLIDVIAEAGIQIDEPRIAQVIRTRELLQMAPKPLPLAEFREMCARAPVILHAITGELCIPDFQVMSMGVFALTSSSILCIAL